MKPKRSQLEALASYAVFATFGLLCTPCPAAGAGVSTIAPGVEFSEQIGKLLAEDGWHGDWCGYSVAISGTTALVGAPHDDDHGTSSGSGYLFDITTGGQIAKLVPDDGATWDVFGWFVAISGTTAVIGAPGDDDNGYSSGSAYLFDTTTGAQVAKLLANDGGESDQFGASVGISGTTAIVGAFGDDDNGNASGSAYVFDTSTGEQIAKLLPDDGAEADFFGNSVAISGTTAIVGCHADDDNGYSSGSAYLFDTTTGEQLAKLLPDDGMLLDVFGCAVGISGTTAIVGAFGDDDNGVDSGSAYLFDTTTGEQIAKLVSRDGAADDWFGESVAISGTTAIVGTYGDDDNGPLSGSAYLFDAATGAQIAKLLADDGADDDDFGFTVAIDGTTAIVGAFRDDDNQTDSGSAYLFDARGSRCLGDVDGNGSVDLDDLLILLSSWGPCAP